MRIREAVEADAEAMAAIADAPSDVMRNLVHDRTVRVAIDPDAVDPDDDADGEPAGAGEEAAIVGFVSFDARDSTVHVTQLDGAADACEQLLAEPVGFASEEGMTVELLAPEDEPQVGDAAEAVGFAEVGDGPTFDGTPTTRYRLEP